MDKITDSSVLKEQKYGGCYFEFVLITTGNLTMTGCFIEINFLQGSWMLLYSKACLNTLGKAVAETRKLNPNYSDLVHTCS